MTVDLLSRAAPNVQAFVLAHLAPLGAVGTRRNPGDPLPFRMVTRITGPSDLFTDYPVVSVHTFGDAAAGQADTLANREADITHRRMLVLLDDPTTPVLMANGVVAYCNYLTVKETPVKVQYRDTTVIRYVGRYELGLDLVNL